VPTRETFEFDEESANVVLREGFVQHAGGLFAGSGKKCSATIRLKHVYEEAEVRIEFRMWKGEVAFGFGGHLLKLRNTASNLGRLSFDNTSAKPFRLGAERPLLIVASLRDGKWLVRCPAADVDFPPVAAVGGLDSIDIQAAASYGMDITIDKVVVDPGRH
jgi:hypothetical protein